jgi:hypothetical protein
MQFLIVAALPVAAPAWAELPVAYDTDYKTLKKEVAGPQRSASAR